MKHNNNSNTVFVTLPIFLLMLSIVLTTGAAYVTHIIWTLTKLMGTTEVLMNHYVLMVLGVVVPPLGTIHGFILWFS